LIWGISFSQTSLKLSHKNIKSRPNKRRYTLAQNKMKAEGGLT
jgi:hypothetical protein